MAKPLPTEAIDSMPQELLAGIGEVVARWGYLHYQLNVIVRLALGVKREAALMLTNTGSLESTCRALDSIAGSDSWVGDADVRSRIKKLSEQISRKKRVRHDYAHGVFGFALDDNRTPSRWVIDRKSGLITTEPLTVQGLKQDALVARDLWTEAQSISQRLKGR
jgi:hypothetical protein